MKASSVLFFLGVCICSRGLAQGMFGGYESDDPTVIARQLLGTNLVYSATVHLMVADEFESFNAEFFQACLGQSIRSEFTISKIPSLHISVSMLNRLQQCGLDRVVCISGPSRAFFVYTNHLAWAETGCLETNRHTVEPFEFRKTEIGRLILDNHPCVEYAVLASGNGRNISARVWEATDMNRFPVRMDWMIDGEDLSVGFSNIDPRPPIQNLFEVPEGYTHYSDLTELAKAICDKQDSIDKK